MVKNDEKFNKYKVKMEANNFFDLYTISEIFSQYPEIARSWKQTEKLAYKLTSNIKQNCQLTISRKEFYNYLLSSMLQCDDVTSPILFSMFNINNDITAVAYAYDKSILCHYSSGATKRALKVQRYTVSCSNRRYVSHYGNFYINEDDILSGRNEQVEFYLKYIPESFRDVSRMVFFDVVTTHNILKLRETCYNVIPNYAKVKTLQQFDNMFNFLLNKNLRLCGFYVTLNACSLDVDISEIMEKYPNSIEQLKKIALKITSTVNSW
jgi:hypothetical protein